LFLSPQGERVGRLAWGAWRGTPGGPVRVRRIFLTSRIELVFLVAVVYDMTIKPAF
jgi:hypothetical protein